MTPAMECPEARVSLGVYVLGAIDPAERALVDAHLATCRDCRDELAGLAGLPALLARVSAEEAVALAAGEGRRGRPGGPGGEAPPELLATRHRPHGRPAQAAPVAGREPRRGGGADHRGRGLRRPAARRGARRRRRPRR